MKIVMLSWEYPPKIVGGIARHAQELSEALAAQGVEVHVITAEHPDAPTEAIENGVHLHRVGTRGITNDFIHWVHQLNSVMEARAEALIEHWLNGKSSRKSREAILIHAHDWLAHFCGHSLKHRYHLPLVATIHATEHGRNHGIHNDTSRYIHQTEWQLTCEAWRVIVCTQFMKQEVGSILGVPDDKMDVVPNGIDAGKFEFDFPEKERAAFRARFAAPDEKIIFFVGRMVREKGAHLLLEALPIVKAYEPKAKLVIAGGGYRDHLTQFSRFARLEPSVLFTGFIPDADLMKLYRVIDVAAYPSLYEPFGIVALEAMASGAPLVVSDAGGFKEVVQHERTGIITWANHSDSLAWGILRALEDPAAARARAQNALKQAKTVFNWQRITRQTEAVYKRVWKEFKESSWGNSSD